MRPFRDLLIVIVLFALLIAFTAISAARRAEIEQQQETFIAYSTHSARSSGTLALRLWLEALGYRTQRLENEAFRVPDEARALFVFPPSEAFVEAEAQSVLRWVERGNTLIVAQDSLFNDNNRLIRTLKARVQPISYAERATLEQPLVTTDVQVRTSAALALERDDFVQYLSASGKPLLVSWRQGRGRVFLTSAPYLFTNDALKDEHNAAVTPALLSGVPRGALVAFDEYHLGFTGESDSLQALLYNTPWGWALLYALLVVFAYLFVNGQRFGRVVPLPREIARRSPAEYVLSMAQLFRRAGKRHMVLQHYRQQLKRTLGRPYRINANLPDDEFVRELAHYRDVNQAELLSTLNELNQPNVSERTLIKLADAAIKLRRKGEA